MSCNYRVKSRRKSSSLSYLTSFSCFSSFFSGELEKKKKVEDWREDTGSKGDVDRVSSVARISGQGGPKKIMGRGARSNKMKTE